MPSSCRIHHPLGNERRRERDEEIVIKSINATPISTAQQLRSLRINQFLSTFGHVILLTNVVMLLYS